MNMPRTRLRIVCSLLFWISCVLPFCSRVYAAVFFVTPGGSGVSCSQVLPCDLPTALAAADHGDTVYVAGGTYTGSGDNVIEVARGITLYGGWDGSPAGPVLRDTTLHKTTLDGEGTRRVVYIGGGISPIIDGFTITNGNATGLNTGCGASDIEGCGGGILVYSSTPTISNNEITDNVATTTINYPSTYAGYGGGIYIVWGGPGTAQIRDNTIRGNTASQANDSWGLGGGLTVYGPAGTPVIENNQITNNIATMGNKTGWGGGLAIHSSDALIQDNLIEGNTAAPAGTSYGSGLYWWYVNNPSTVQDNRIQGNNLGTAVYLGYFSGTFERNAVINNGADTGMSLVNQLATPGPTSLINNMISGGTTNTLTIDGYSAYPITATLTNNTLVGEGTQYGVYIAEYATVTMTNNIVSGYTTGGVVVNDPGSVTLTQDHSLFYGNLSDGERGTNPVDGNPIFVNAEGNDYHIKGGSAARNTGAAVGAPSVDFDGQSRPQGVGYDIGADEFQSRNNGPIQMLLLPD